MKYVNSCGTLCVPSEDKGKFVNFMAAVMALNAIQLFYASQGFGVYSSISEKAKHVEVRIHFGSFNVPTLPACYLYSKREITSCAFNASTAKSGERVRVVTYYFDF